MKNRHALVLIAAVLGVTAGAATFAADGNYPAIPLVNSAPNIDGKLDDPCWSSAFSAKLEQRAESSKFPPEPCEPATAKVVCDKENFYVAFSAEDTSARGPYVDPSKIELKFKKWRNVTEHVMGSDYVCFLIDPGHYGLYDYFLFFVSPDGALYSTVSWPTHPNSQEDLIAPPYAVTFAAATNVEKGKRWTAELKIPFKEILRHPGDGMIDTVGVNFRRMQWGKAAGTVDNKPAWNLVLQRDSSHTHFRHLVSWQPYKSWKSWAMEGEIGWPNMAYADEFGLVKVAAGTRKTELATGSAKAYELPVEFTWMKLHMKDFWDKPRMPRRDDLRPDSFEKVATKSFDGGVPKLAAARFASPPSATVNGKTATLKFALAAPADVTVGVVNAQGKVVRHLGFGLLGGNAPAPFQANSLAQELTWDFCDDFGKPLPKGAYKFKVKAGLKTSFVRALDFTIRKGDLPTWPQMLDTENLPNPKPAKNKHDHGGGGGSLPALNRFTNELFLPGYDVYDASSGEKKRVFKWKQPIATAIDLTANGELAFAPDGHMYLSGINHLFKANAGGQLEKFESMAVNYVPNLFRGHSNPHRGHCVGPDGDIYYIHHYMGHGNADSQVTRIGADGRLKQFGIVNLPGISVAGIKVGRDGSIYLGCTLNPKDRAIPPDLRSLPEEVKKLYALTYGSIVKFRPSGGQTKLLPESSSSDLVASTHNRGFTQFPVQLEGADWVHPGLAQIITRARGNSPVACVCQNARFDLDDYGRLYVPDAIAGRVTVLDANGNAVTRIGKRGLSLQAQEFRFPSTLVASDEYLHVQDSLFSKSAQLKIEYAAEGEAEVSR